MKKLFLSAFLIFLAAGLFANEDFSFYADVNFGPGNTIINEALYDKEGKDRQVSSLLTWESYSLPSFEASLGFILFGKYFLSLNGEYVIPAFSGKLEDFDWMNLFSTGDSNLTHYSKHENFLDNNYEGSVFLGYCFNPSSRLKLIPFLSFKYSYLSFTSINGYRQYGANIGTENGSNVYESWTSDIEKKELSGKIITLEEENYFIGLGSQINFKINDSFDSVLFLQILPSIKSHALDTHHRRSTKYTLFESTNKLALDSSFLLQYKISNAHRFSLKTSCSWSFADNINLYQSASKNNWMGVSNPGKLRRLDFSFAAGYTYYYEK